MKKSKKRSAMIEFTLVFPMMLVFILLVFNILQITINRSVAINEVNRAVQSYSGLTVIGELSQSAQTSINTPQDLKNLREMKANTIRAEVKKNMASHGIKIEEKDVLLDFDYSHNDRYENYDKLSLTVTFQSIVSPSLNVGGQTIEFFPSTITLTETATMKKENIIKP